MQVQIRRATAADAKAVCEIVLRAVRETNARDYPASVIDRLASTLPEKVASKLEEWHAYVAQVGDRIVGTGSLNGQIVMSRSNRPRQARRRAAIGASSRRHQNRSRCPRRTGHAGGRLCLPQHRVHARASDPPVNPVRGCQWRPTAGRRRRQARLSRR
jgi:hypothetical protein